MAPVPSPVAEGSVVGSVSSVGSLASVVSTAAPAAAALDPATLAAIIQAVQAAMTIQQPPVPPTTPPPVWRLWRGSSMSSTMTRSPSAASDGGVGQKVKVELTDRALKLRGRMALKDLHRHSARTLADTDAAASAALGPTPKPSTAVGSLSSLGSAAAMPPPTVLFGTPKPTTIAVSPAQSPATPTSVAAPQSVASAATAKSPSMEPPPAEPSVEPSLGVGAGILVVPEQDNRSPTVDQILALGSKHPEYKRLYNQFTRHAQSEFWCFLFF